VRKPHDFAAGKIALRGYGRGIAVRQFRGVYAPRRVAKLRSNFALPLRRARDSGGAIAPTTIHTYRKATVFGRIAAESPVFCPWFPRAKNAPKFRISNEFLNRLLEPVQYLSSVP
jgi:hypothetical protein